MLDLTLRDMMQAVKNRKPLPVPVGEGTGKGWKAILTTDPITHSSVTHGKCKDRDS